MYRKLLWLGLFLGFFAVASLAAEVKNINAYQDGNRLVVSYDLEGDKPADISALIAITGRLHTNEALHLEGDVGQKVGPGKNKQITWNILKDYPQGIAAEVLISIQPKTKRLVESDIVSLSEQQTEVFRRIDAENIDVQAANRHIVFSEKAKKLASIIGDKVKASYVKEVDESHLEKSRYYCARFQENAQQRRTSEQTVAKDDLAKTWESAKHKTPVVTDENHEKYFNCLLASLDPHSSYLTPEAYRELQVSTKGTFAGLGIEISIKDGILTVVSPIEDTPAFRAGIKAGDQILQIDGKPTKDLTIMDSVKLMRGQKGTRVTLTIARQGVAELMQITIMRDVIMVRSVRSRTLANGYGYIRITQFQEKTSEDFGKALESLRSESGGTLKGLILDLRNDPGGLLNSAISVASRFVDTGMIVYTQGRDRHANSQYQALKIGKEPGYPIVLLINRGSASASEIVAGALQDHRRAIVLGTQSFGKGTVQSILPFDDSAIRLTTANYYTPNGRSIQQIGIVPDIPIEQDFPSDEAAIAFAQRLLLESSAISDASLRKEIVEKIKLDEFFNLNKNAIRSNISAYPQSTQVAQGKPTQPARPSANTSEPVVAMQETQKENRVALVIGNAAYSSSPLKNPVNDARAISAKLKTLGFDVITRENVAQKEMTRAITQFGEKLARANTVGLFYYAGHGMQVRGKNYLIPVDAQISSEASIRSEAVDADSLLEQLASSTLGIVILDACRNNPFERRFRGASGGLAQMDAPKGILIAYATAPGKVASDGDGRNGLYTQKFLKVLDERGLKVEDVFKRVRKQVADATADQQVPWESSSLTGDFYFVRPTQAPAESRTQDTELLFWQTIKESKDIEDFNAYLKKYPKGQFADIARNRLKKFGRK